MGMYYSTSTCTCTKDKKRNAQVRNVESATYNADADTSKMNPHHIVASHAGMLSIAGNLPDMCSLSFWYQLQTCEITLLQEVSSY
jgi:hypothetical protein